MKSGDHIANKLPKHYQYKNLEDLFRSTLYSVMKVINI